MSTTENEIPRLPESRLAPPFVGEAANGTKPSAPAFLINISRTGNRTITPVPAMMTIGNDPACGLRLLDPSVNPRHARIENRANSWLIRDLQSPQGIWVNDTRVMEAPLSNLDRIRIGEALLLFQIGHESNGELTSKNEKWNQQLQRLPAFSITDHPVLMIGPSGSGKEVLARAIHASSRRRNGPLISINCGALSESLIESELFGHVRGSFTGATHDRKGAFESARGGTLMLDEVGDLPLSLQPKLLRALENKEIRPVGSDRTIETDVRVLAATHKDLAGLVAQGRFREDLYWRLNVCMIEPPPLNERMEDFTDLVYAFCKQMRVRLSFGAIEKLKTHTWPGNVRELKNVISRANAYFPGHYIQAEDIDSLVDRRPLFNMLRSEASEVSATAATVASQTPIANGPTGSGGSIMREIEREMIIRRLVANRGNQRKTAVDLGMPKSTLHDRLKTYSIDVEEIKEIS